MEKLPHTHDGEGSGRCRGWDGAGGAMESCSKADQCRLRKGRIRRNKTKKAMGSYYLIVQGYGEVPPGALHLVLGTLLL